MSDWEGPRLARPDEFGEAMRFTDMVFRPGQRGRRIVQSQYPHAYRDEPAFARRLLLLRDAGELVGCLAIHPMTLRLGEARLRAGGIGIVGTHPERRGEGIMTRLLDDAIVRMRRAGHAVSILGGDRQRYGRFGWENAGARNVFHLTDRSLGKASKAERGLEMRRHQIDDDASLRRILRLSGERSFGVVRRQSDVGPLLQRRGKEAWICRDGRRFAYAVAGGEDRRPRPYTEIHELGGDPDLCLALCRRLLPRTNGGRLSVVAGPNADEVGLLQPVSAAWFRMADGMVNALNAAAVCAQLQPELRRRAREHGVGGRVTFEVRAVAGEDLQAGCVDLGPGRAHRVRLDQRDFVDLLFGCLPLREAAPRLQGLTAAARRVLAPLLPLPLHVPSLSHI